MPQYIRGGRLLAITALSFFLLLSSSLSAQHSVARQWNEVLLNGIRKDFARPTVHARNLFHVSVAMYDAWAAYSFDNDTYFLGNTIHGFECPYTPGELPADIQAAQEKAMSYAVYRLMLHRFQNSPGIAPTYFAMDDLMGDLGYDISVTDTNYTTGDPAMLGNYIALQLIRYGLQDGANEPGGYANQYYEPINAPLIPMEPGNPLITDPNHWQPLTLEVFIDQGGNPIPINTPPFLSPEWGNVEAFALTEADLTTYTRDSNDYRVYHDPGPPPYFDDEATKEYYKWGFELVSVWSSHLDTVDEVLWDISPASIGNNPPLPTDIADYENFYDLIGGGDQSQGHTVNPATGQPYAPQMVRRGDYARVLAEFWADGPDSETPPGHWFTILNYVNDHPMLVKKFKGQGEVRDDLEWDVKSYFLLGSAMHDVAISAWGIKGWYDYLRPISAIRFLADNGQSSDSTLASYSPDGINLIPGYIELVESGDPLEGDSGENVGKIKLFAWQGPDTTLIADPEVDMAGVGWILAENWWPYQRPSFVTPPFAGYVSGHSTYSRAAAEILTSLTGDPFFPGGMGEFEAPRNEFLVFEDGPSQDLTLQWATYRDASDQCSLSRIWGGIHPPCDDIPGRFIGIAIGNEVFAKAETYFDIFSTAVAGNRPVRVTAYPNPVKSGGHFRIQLTPDAVPVGIYVYNAVGALEYMSSGGSSTIDVPSDRLARGMHFIRIIDAAGVTYNGEISIL